MADDLALFSELVSEGTTRYLVSARRMGDEGGQVRYRFPNGMGASVVRYGWRTPDGSLVGTYGAEEGLFEVMVLRWPEAGGAEDGSLAEAHPLTGDGGVRGWMEPRDVEEMLLALMREQPNALTR